MPDRRKELSGQLRTGNPGAEGAYRHAASSHRPVDKRDPYPSPFNDYPPPSERELERLRESMREAKDVLAAWAAQTRKGTVSC